MRKFGRLIAFFVFSTLLLSQSVVDVAKKEQERREKLKGKNAKVVTNADLKTIKRGSAVETSGTPAPTGEAGTTETPEVMKTYDGGFDSPFAGEVLSDTAMVDNPDAALGSPDGQYAEISLNGVLELGVSVVNGDGPDLVVHARIAGLEAAAGGQEEGIPAGFLAAAQPGIPPMYGVLVLDDNGIWQAIGKDTGSGGPASFDLGDIPSSKRIKIIFHYLDVPDLGTAGVKTWRMSEKEVSMGIDAVEALH
jgi:hypothetical protein